MSEYLKLKSTNERQSINIETRIVEPQTISDNASGGQATFLLPTSGLLDRGTRVVIPVKGSDADQMFALTWSVVRPPSQAGGLISSQGVLP